MIGKQHDILGKWPWHNIDLNIFIMICAYTLYWGNISIILDSHKILPLIKMMSQLPSMKNNSQTKDFLKISYKNNTFRKQNYLKTLQIRYIVLNSYLKRCIKLRAIENIRKTLPRIRKMTTAQACLNYINNELCIQNTLESHEI